MAGISKIKLTKHLNQLSEEELRSEILKLFENIPAVKDFYGLDLGDKTVVLEEYTKKIQAKFFTAHGNARDAPKMSEIRAIITQFKKISPLKHHVIELLLYRVMITLDFFDIGNYIPANTIEPTISAFADALALIHEYNLLAEYKAMCLACVFKANGDYGYGIDRSILRLYADAYDVTFSRVENTKTGKYDLIITER